MKILGIDTSNYTTSLAVVSDGGYINERRILDVAVGERGLRQSNALFLHTKNLPELFEKLGDIDKTDAIAVSDKPRDEDGSYMPCFLAGVAAASAAAKAAGAPIYRFSHQAGHIMAAAMTSDEPSIIEKPLLCFHVSGGTTELVYAIPDDDRGFAVKVIGGTLDISAGQLIDRTGVLIGLKFPCGNELEKLAQGGKSTKVKISKKGAFCNYSGAENIVQKMLAQGFSQSDVARFALDYCAEAIIASVRSAREEFSDVPVLFAGGVMRNKIIRAKILCEIKNAYFGSVELSSDNAVGVAWLGMKKHERIKNGAN
ncbi:MAG: hypothetical protein IJR55_00230 [Clostridia bacterium]|nr:hypothetical protein [Clostridia bacterium]